MSALPPSEFCFRCARCKVILRLERRKFQFMSTAATAFVDRFEIAGHAFHSRIIIGTGKYRSYDEMKAAHRAAGAEMVTIAVRRVPLDRSSESFLDHLNPSVRH